ncbi:MAG: hypothetical protein H6537_05425 [Bacteroidales bacterium]|nr:hypothetical protein [Bacteroidales bacterium]HPD94833.1 hypothetical protein [Tenuifilaceae bacterium]HRX30506.1 hypothetical protein [Tenuifilaceae bacterium]
MTKIYTNLFFNVSLYSKKNKRISMIRPPYSAFNEESRLKKLLFELEAVSPKMPDRSIKAILARVM